MTRTPSLPKVLILGTFESVSAPLCPTLPMRDHPSAVLPGLGPGIHDFAGAILKSWMAGPSPARTRRGRCELDRGKIRKL